MTAVREIMRRELVTVDPSITVTEAAHAMLAGQAGSALVLEGGSLAGIFTERDILRAMSESPSADGARVSSVSRWMTRDPVTIGPDTSVGEALDRMLDGGVRHLPVLEGETLLGMVSMRDLAGGIARRER
jgi:CBS domain-containing protein